MDHATSSLQDRTPISGDAKNQIQANLTGLPPKTLAQLVADAGRILRKKYRQFFIVAALIFLGVLLVAYGRSQKYESNAKLMVQLDMQMVALSQSEIRYNLATKMADEVVGNQVEMLRSRELIERVIDEVGVNVLEGPPKSGFVGFVLNTVKSVQQFGTDTLIFLGLAEATSARSNLVNTISDNLKVLPARKSQLIDISLRLKNREAAQKILSTLLRLHTQKLAEMDATTQAYSVYNEQANQIKSQLENAVTALSNFKIKNGFVDLATEKVTMLKNADRLSALLDGIEGGDISSISSTEDSDLDSPLQTSIGGNDLARLAGRVNELRLERSRRGAVYVNGNIKIDETQAQLSSAEKLLAEKIRSVRAAANNYRARSKFLDSLQPEFDRLTREVNMTEENYKAYVKSTEDRRLSTAKDRRVLLTLVDQANLPEGPVAPTRLMIVVGGFFGSLLLAALSVLVANWWLKRREFAR